MINGQCTTINQKTKKQTEDLMFSGSLTSTENYILKWEMRFLKPIYKFVLSFTAKFTLKIMVPEFCSDDNSTPKGALWSNAS